MTNQSDIAGDPICKMDPEFLSGIQVQGFFDALL